MAVGDTVNALESVAAAVATQIRPGSGIEWVVHNIYYATDIGVRWADGTNTLTFASYTGAGSVPRMVTHVTNTRYLEVVNIAATALIAWDAVVTKSA